MCGYEISLSAFVFIFFSSLFYFILFILFACNYLQLSPSSFYRYTPRIYLTEGTGAVLGANAINEHNVIFDPDGLRVGFARSLCIYDQEHSSHDFATSTNDAPKTTTKAPVVQTKSSVSSKPAQKVEPVAVAPTPKKGGNGAVSASALLKMKAKENATAANATAPSQATPPAGVRTPLPAVATAPTQNNLKGTVAVKTAKASFLFPVPLTPVYKENLALLVATAAEDLVTARTEACRRVLTMPCNARCDRPPSPEVQALDFGNK